MVICLCFVYLIYLITLYFMVICHDVPHYASFAPSCLTQIVKCHPGRKSFNFNPEPIACKSLGGCMAGCFWVYQIDNHPKENKVQEVIQTEHY